MKRFSIGHRASVFPVRRRALAIPLALVCVCALCVLTSLPSYVTTSASERQLPIYCVQRDYKVCSLTFDAAWGEGSLRRLGGFGAGIPL